MTNHIHPLDPQSQLGFSFRLKISAGGEDRRHDIWGKSLFTPFPEHLFSSVFAFSALSLLLLPADPEGAQGTWFCLGEAGKIPQAVMNLPLLLPLQTWVTGCHCLSRKVPCGRLCVRVEGLKGWERTGSNRVHTQLRVALQPGFFAPTHSCHPFCKWLSPWPFHRA